MWINTCIILENLNPKKHPETMKNLVEILTENATHLSKSEKFSNLGIDFDFKKLQVLPFFEKLLEDETLQAEYRLDDIATILLVFYENQAEVEEMIEKILREPVENNYFLHYGKYLERCEAYEYVFKAVIMAFEKVCTVFQVFENTQKMVVARINLCPQLPMEERNQYALLSVSNIIPYTQDPAIYFPVHMN